ncbi:hypothetical protein D3C87_1217540 [compost metagenome]
MSSPFDWQFKHLPALTQHALDALQQKYDHFGQPFRVGDRVLQVVLASSAKCCGFRQQLVSLHESSIPLLESKYGYHLTKMGIPRYVLKTT